MGSKAYSLIDKYCKTFKENEVVVEIGSLRGEGSTDYIAKFCKERDITFYSIDFESSAYNRVKNIEGVYVYRCTGENFLLNIFPKLGGLEGGKLKIRFAYLDNFDWIWDGTIEADWIKDQISLYKKYNLDMNNENSQRAHYEQSVLIDKYSSDNCLVLFDDTWQTYDGGYSGKGGRAVPMLLSLGYKLVPGFSSLKDNKVKEIRESFVAVYKGNLE